MLKGVLPSALACAAAVSGTPGFAADKVQESFGRSIYLTGEIDDTLVSAVKARTETLNHQDTQSPIVLHINSPGGNVASGQELLKITEKSRAPIHTNCDDFCGAMAAVILSAGEPGHRSVYKDATIFMRGLGELADDPSASPSYKTYIRDLNEELVRTFSKTTGQTANVVRQ